MTSEAHPLPSIKTDVSEFCQEFTELLAPYENTVRNSLREIQKKADGESLKRPIAGLADVHHRIESLHSKVKEQQAYVLIFGPLKSGKSSLMNAISATYVSEVTSLPAYPCLVHVKHGEQYKFTVNRYNGDKIPYADNKSLQLLVRNSHKILAERIREVEESGEKFDPGVHNPEAIRRIDVEVPARNLKESLTVLVDTPGLYTKMKFGYDLITREFRNNAACAVFVVKTDNLFLEQVFDEFTQLLDLFSRIFLVVNIDSNKRDLNPDGSLKPSLESESPEEIVNAFKSLVMGAPLRNAYEEGRLKIYPIDLLNAAATSLRENPETAEDPVEIIQAPEEPAATSEPEVPENETASAAPITIADGAFTQSPPPPDSFSTFLGDLTDYLNSSDYLQEFMGDSLHQGETLTSEIQQHCSAQTLEAFHEHQKNLRSEAEEISELLNAIEKLQALNWNSAFEKTRKLTANEAREFSEKVRRDTGEKASTKLDQWMESDESFAKLEQSWNTHFDHSRIEIEKNCAEQVRALVADSYGGIDFDQEHQRCINLHQQILQSAIQTARTDLKNAELRFPDCKLKIPVESVKVKKRIWDWMLFRSQKTVFHRIFGEEGSLDQSVPPEIKKKRLDEEGRHSLHDAATTHLAESLAPEAVKFSEKLLTIHTETLAKELSRAFKSAKDEYSRKKSDCEKRLQDTETIQEHLDELSKTSARLAESIGELKEKHHAKNWNDHNPSPSESPKAVLEVM